MRWWRCRGSTGAGWSWPMGSPACFSTLQVNQSPGDPKGVAGQERLGVAGCEGLPIMAVTRVHSNGHVQELPVETPHEGP